MSIKKWFLGVIKNIDDDSNFNRMRKHIDQVVFNVDARIREPLGFSNKWDWIVRFKIGEYSVKYTWQIRGSLIEVSIGGKEIAEWVDQTHQYGWYLGLNDIVYAPFHVGKYVESINTSQIIMIS